MSVAGIKDLQKRLGDKADLFDMEVVGEYIIARPKQYLTNFNECATAFRAVGGNYVGGLGKKSHFTVPLKEGTEKETPRQLQLLRDGIDLIEKGLTKLREAGY